MLLPKVEALPVPEVVVPDDDDVLPVVDVEPVVVVEPVDVEPVVDDEPDVEAAFALLNAE